MGDTAGEQTNYKIAIKSIYQSTETKTQFAEPDLDDQKSELIIKVTPVVR
jgi:hypothetical protein